MVASILLIGAITVLVKPGQDRTDNGVLPAFDNYNEVRLFLGATGHQQSLNSSAESGAGDKVAASALGSDVLHSDTKVQVEGVDEADSIKTDGSYFYVIASDNVSILDAYPAGNLSNVSKVNMHEALGLDPHYSVWINGIYVQQQKLIVVASVAGPYQYYDYNSSAPLASMIWRMPDENTEVAIFSLAEVDHPVLIKVFGISGSPITSRMTGDCVYVLAQQCIWD